MPDDEDSSDLEPLRIEAIRHRTEVTIIVEGYLDVETSPRFRESVNDVLATRPRSMAIDASRVMFVDSSGLGALLPGSWSCCRGNDVQRSGPSKPGGRSRRRPHGRRPRR